LYERIDSPSGIYSNKKFEWKSDFCHIGLVRFDIHIHTTISPCSALLIGDILAHARSRGLDGVCITDHNSMEVCRHIREGVQEDGLVVIVGMEYDTPEGDFLVFGPMEGIRPGMSASNLLENVRSTDGAAVAAHPFRNGRSTAGHLFSSGLVGVIEAVNGRNTPEENALVNGLLEHYPLIRCGGSDAHALDELGCAATRFLVPVWSRMDLIHALSRGLCSPEEGVGGQAPAPCGYQP